MERAGVLGGRVGLLGSVIPSPPTPMIACGPQASRVSTGPSSDVASTRADSLLPTKMAERIDWATLMHRVWGWDVLACPACGGRMRFIKGITQRAVIDRILKHVGLSSEPVVPARGRSWEDTS